MLLTTNTQTEFSDDNASSLQHKNSGVFIFHFNYITSIRK